MPRIADSGRIFSTTDQHTDLLCVSESIHCAHSRLEDFLNATLLHLQDNSPVVLCELCKNRREGGEITCHLPRTSESVICRQKTTMAIVTGEEREFRKPPQIDTTDASNRAKNAIALAKQKKLEAEQKPDCLEPPLVERFEKPFWRSKEK